MYPLTKVKMKQQRQKRIRRFFNNHYEGSDVTWCTDEWTAPEGKRLILMHKEQLNDTYYFVCKKQNESNMQIMKLVYTEGLVRIIKVSDKTFAKNKAIFSEWIDIAEIKNGRYHY